MIQVEIIARISHNEIMSREYPLVVARGETMAELESSIITGLRITADEWAEIAETPGPEGNGQ